MCLFIYTEREKRGEGCYKKKRRRRNFLLKKEVKLILEKHESDETI